MYRIKHTKEAKFFHDGKVYLDKDEVHDDLLREYTGKAATIETLSVDEILVLMDLSLIPARPTQCKATFAVDGDELRIIINGSFFGRTHLGSISPEVRKHIFH